MIPRYSPNDVAALFSDAHRFDTMLEVELLAAEALAEQGVLPSSDVRTLRVRRPVVDASFVAEVDERELVTNHDTAAFVDVVQARIGMPEGAWIHYRLPSSDVGVSATSKPPSARERRLRWASSRVPWARSRTSTRK